MSAVATLAGMAAVFVWRIREGRTAVIVLAAIRFVAHTYLDTVITVEQTAGLFFVLAFGMILRWRLNMFLEFRALTASTAE